MKLAAGLVGGCQPSHWDGLFEASIVVNRASMFASLTGKCLSETFGRK
jgi:hypothetical protein